MTPKSLWGAAISKLRKTQPGRESDLIQPEPTQTQHETQSEPTLPIYPRFKRPVSNKSSVYSEFMFPPTPLPTVPMAPDSNLDPLAMASTISQARLNALHSGQDLDSFFKPAKDCIDAYAQASKAMVENACARHKDGEDPPYEEIEQIKERFFRYCQSIVGEALSLINGTANPCRLEVSSNSTIPSLISSTSNTTGSEPKAPFQSGSSADRSAFSEALLASSGRRSLRLYTVSSDDWVMVPSMPTPTSPTRVVIPENMDPVEESIHFGVIVRIFGKLYTMSKMMEIIILYYGVEDDNSETGLSCWIKRSEQNVRTQNMAVLIDTVENLYYALYARVTIELASIELCGSYRVDLRALRIELPFLMPEADHLYRIVLAFKDVLNSPEICAIRRTDVIAYFQQGYVNQVMKKKSKQEHPFFDPLGFRPFAMRTVSYRHGSYCEKWKGIIPFFNRIPAETMATMSEKYLTMTPVTIPLDDIPLVELPWIYPDNVGMAVWDTDIVSDYRMCEAAKKLGTTIGEERKKEPAPGLYHLIRQRKCICKSICSCSSECTQDVQRGCPCAERHVRIMTTKRGLAQRRNGPTFAATATTTARMFFHGLVELKRDVEPADITNELDQAFELFSLLISAERDMALREESQASL
ncbi:hypothetical protein N7491_010737 [Penicillium cf. griseofulvum]|uniref:Uncharacterized protein n=1 Tax=Penicillium cf. griseofulvum TaxID=2972120 RepID=A0A9W9N0Q3_9EURO|nr:hypothetical protein N7472_001061 [Penicillium cf. griseofulvum]KAJ5422292.1 hypothetical protein N7491_010737 [Penicillium cf. griseofulvum]KAJ5428475.1 hypothetical protein N7445_009929 [Penicillium cf. griseofulvum]